MTDMHTAIALPMMFALGVLLGYLVRRPRIVLASDRDMEAPPQVATVAEAREALDQFAGQYQRREVLDIGWDYVQLADAMSRAELQVRQAEQRPGDKREASEAVASVNRLSGRVEALNLRQNQLVSGEWPE